MPYEEAEHTVEEAAADYEQEWCFRFAGREVVGGFEIQESGNPSARIFSTEVMDVEQ